MKNKVLFIFISVFVLLIGVNKISAFTLAEAEHDGEIDITDDFVLEKFKTTFSNFDETSYKNFHCTVYSSYVLCRSFVDECFSNLTGDDNLYRCSVPNFRLNLYYSGVSFSPEDNSSGSNISFRFKPLDNTQKVYSNFDIDGSSYNEQVNVLFKSESEPEEPVSDSLNILSYSTENFDKILSKATDICSYLFTQELFLMCLSVVLFYIVFLIIFKFIR